MGTKKSKSRRVTDVRRSSPELFHGLWYTEVEYRLDGVLKIKQFSGLTNHEVLTKANEFIDGLM